ncbi:MAG: hypothetical protein KC416_15595, partial [Myxococcales bacterium]|nr:hypothetical protein [Myxococcales bacterium]
MAHPLLYWGQGELRRMDTTNYKEELWTAETQRVPNGQGADLPQGLWSLRATMSMDGVAGGLGPSGVKGRPGMAVVASPQVSDRGSLEEALIRRNMMPMFFPTPLSAASYLGTGSAYRPTCLFVEIDAPRVRELIVALRELPGFGSIPMVGLVQMVDERAIRRAFALGLEDVLDGRDVDAIVHRAIVCRDSVGSSMRFEQIRGDALVVGDAQARTKLLRLFLWKLGYRVTVVGDASQVKGELRERLYDLVVMDVQGQRVDRNV